MSFQCYELCPLYAIHNNTSDRYTTVAISIQSLYFPSFHTDWRQEGTRTGIPLEQLIPAPLTTITFFAFAIDIDTSSSFLRKPNSAWSVDASRCGRSRWVMGIVVYVWFAVRIAVYQAA